MAQTARLNLGRMDKASALLDISHGLKERADNEKDTEQVGWSSASDRQSPIAREIGSRSMPDCPTEAAVKTIPARAQAAVWAGWAAILRESSVLRRRSQQIARIRNARPWNWI